MSSNLPALYIGQKFRPKIYSQFPDSYQDVILLKKISTQTW